MAWHGRYASFFEAASTELRRSSGLSYPALIAAGLRMPVVRFHVDYLAPVRLDDLATVEASLIWNEAARLNIEYAIFRPDGSLATTGYTVQLFTDASTGQLLLASPDILVQQRLLWTQGRLGHLQ
jgi:acyl-CoA thioester hydrolase